MPNSSKKASRRSVLTASLAAVAAPALIGSAFAQEKITWKVQAHWPKASGSFNDSLGVLAKELEERTEGRFKLETFGAGEIAKDREIYNIVRRGVVPMGTISPAYILGEAQAMGLLYGVPGTLRESWELMHLTKNLGIEDLVNEELKPNGVVIMAEKAYPTEVVLKKKILSAADLGSLKIRSAGTMLQYLAAAGASPQQIAGPEIYQAISTGVVDGAHWGAAVGALSMKFWEVAPYHMKPALGMANDAYIINKAALEKLPPDLRLQFVSLVEERYFRRSVEYQHQEAIALTTGKTKMNVEVVRFPDDVLKKFAEASKGILSKETAKGDRAAKGGEALTKLMTDLGYV
ncbi:MULTISPECIES: TRAP transporter substrate-binding protein DctP [Rhodopseudomonas]|uniref:ABC transporter substrate-binding protein n=1 Tax=Rhodopseudomonas palustris TaxID=1076 RepID=A0A0D7E6Z5_RHOPL|nr:MULTISPECIES: TRAP transporter substrate-binding protein DctP [Rhodopseudomonas]KIZ35287.1 ABC transporter substrate-binding protein [Rhodopseudomonas palustris]MDF3809852.1 TRAP transporter substrate-binding protein DctP [Rhodopseudomonas sp. BAL398]WOK15528.1 TRAP transporter substrate-binding protein DctP [Rhodopseudomonas sp. BAL398]